jgi:hypothetical protein
MLEGKMLEWRPRLIVLLVTLAVLASAVGFTMAPLNFGWDFF